MATVDPTPNYGWNLPDDQGDSGNWGAMLRAILGDDATGIDAILKAVSDVADAAMPRAGGVFTGEIDILTARYELVNLGSLSGAQAINLAAGNFFYGTVAGATTFSFSNVPADGVFIVLELTNAGTNVTWPPSVTWPDGTEPSLTAAGVDILTFLTRDGGTTWRGALAMRDLS